MYVVVYFQVDNLSSNKDFLLFLHFFLTFLVILHASF